LKLDTASPPYVVAFAALVPAAFTAIVVSLQVAAEPVIARHEAVRQRRALVKVFELVENVEALPPEEAARIVEARIDPSLEVTDPVTKRTFRVYRAADEDGRPVGVAFTTSGNGFWAPIAGLMALAPDRRTVLRMVFTDNRETPGLGGRITEEAFQKGQFAGLDASPPAEGRPYLTVASERPEGGPRARRTVQAITGATQTSRAVVKFVSADLAAFQRAMDAQGPR
jgi:Na+-transporting NADH:ubiquinone oxidoreductase subunit C